MSAPQIEQSARFIASAMDVLSTRVADSLEPPPWAVTRGWDAWLSIISDETLREAEHSGLRVTPGMPASLSAFLEEISDLTRLPRLVPDVEAKRLHHANVLKQREVAAFVAACEGLLPSRIVDVGSGHGHLTRALAEAWQARAVGLEWNPSLVERARKLTARVDVEFAQVNALGGFALSAGDLVVGLHACGALGDALVAAACSAHVDAALVACCPQKIPGDARRGFHPLTPAIPKHALGLANVSPRLAGVEVDHDVDLEAREAKLTLRQLLRARGVDVAAGQEMRGVNRRTARLGAGELAKRVFEHLELAPPSTHELTRARTESSRVHAHARRMDLPRAALGRALEVMLALDRAWKLEQAGLPARVGIFVDPAVSPRNIMVLTSSRTTLTD